MKHICFYRSYAVEATDSFSEENNINQWPQVNEIVIFHKNTPLGKGDRYIMLMEQDGKRKTGFGENEKFEENTPRTNEKVPEIVNVSNAHKLFKQQRIFAPFKNGQKYGL